MSYQANEISSSPEKNEQKNSGYEEQMIDWLLSDYQDESQLLPPHDIQNRLMLINNKILLNEENLFLIKSILKMFRKQLKIDFLQEQKLTIIMLNFVEKAQKEQIKKIKNAHAIAGKVILWTKGNASIANTIFRTLLHSNTLIRSDYLENLTLWLTSDEKDLSQLLTKEKLELALQKSAPDLTPIENKFLVRSLVFNLRS